MMSHINLCMIRNKKPYICGGYHISYFKPNCKEKLLHLVRTRSSQKATAAAAATLSESTLCDIGMRTT